MVATGGSEVPNTNHWGHPIPAIAEIASDPATREHLASQLTAMLGGPRASRSLMSVAEQLLELASQEVPRYESDARALLLAEELVDERQCDLRRATKHLFHLCRPHLGGSRLIDFGCGSGIMGRRFARSGLDVTLSDVLEPTQSQASVLPFVLADADGFTPLPESVFDNAVALGVLHHCSDPVRAAIELMRLVAPGGRLVIVESVFGVQPHDLEKHHPFRDSPFVQLPLEQQFRHTMYFDHFVNRVAGSHSDDPARKVNMPFNYNTISGWNETFGRLGGRAVHTSHLEVQVGRAPLHHTLHVVEKGSSGTRIGPPGPLGSLADTRSAPLPGSL